jgi:hypothetical protein
MAHYTPGPVVAPLTRTLLLALPAVALAAGDRVGPEACKTCHPAAYEAWHTGPHARAEERLPPASRADGRCRTCHAPDAADGIGGVSCEACHGPGRLYAVRHVMRDPELARAVGLVDPDEKSCLACHTVSTPSLVPFRYGRKLPLVDHWTAERAARTARETAPARAPAAPSRPRPPSPPRTTPPALPAAPGR